MYYHQKEMNKPLFYQLRNNAYIITKQIAAILLPNNLNPNPFIAETILNESRYIIKIYELCKQ
ncbi:hypothetical protein Hanom_Chr12g01177801 [Helianthus anomalus]